MSFDPDLYLADEGQPDGSSPSPAPAAGSPAGPDESRQIAIVGLAGRFPGARDLDEYWRNLREGRETITFFPESEMELPAWSRFNPKDPNYVRAAGILDDADCFDAGLFGYSPREAQYMDPQQRVFLELCWAALEHAGYDPRATGKRVGVYAGTVYSTYLWMMLGEGVLGNPAERMLATIGNLEDNLTTRVAYKLNLRGPAVTVQTACSSSLVAVNLACQSLLAGKCEMALAGGVAIVFPQKTGYLHNPDLIDSRDGHCRAFCRGSTGAIFSNGAGVVVLKTLAAARRDGDTIHAVILGSAVNNDGNDKIGFTAPSVSGQVAVIREALGQANVDPATISCIEAHGTGTPLGDPIEIAALAEAFGGNRLPRGSCAIGSVKTNIGHLNSAAGVAGLIKAVLALRHQEIPPSLHFEEPNPELDLANTPFYVNARLQPWAQGATPRRIGVSSFGIGGTNAHAILQEAEAPVPSTPAAGPHVLTVSGRDAAALQARVHRLADWLDAAAPTPGLGDLAFTLNCGRTHFSHRVAFVTESVEEFRAQLRSFATTGHARGALPGAKTADGGPVPPAPETCRFGSAGPASDDPAHRRSVGALAAAYAAGRNLDWSTYYEAGFFRRLPLPAYPFARTRHWLHARPQTAAAPAGAATPATANSVEELGGDWLQLEDRLFRRKLQVSDPTVGDHRVGGQVVFPGVAHLELARATAAHVTRQPIRRLCQVHWLRPLVIQGVEGEAFVRLEPAAPGCRYTVGCSSPAGDVVHSEGEAFPGPAYPIEQHEAGWLAAFQASAGPASPGAELYAEFARRGVNYGPHYRGLRSLWTRAGEVLALVEAPPPPPGTAESILPPALLDAALQCTAGLYSESQRLSGAAFLPYSVAEIQLRRPLPHRVYVHVRPHGRETNPDLRRFDLDVLDESGAICVRFVDLCAKAAPAHPPAAAPAQPLPPPAPRQPLAAPAAASLAAQPTPAGLEARLQRHFATTLNVAENEIDPDQAYSEYGVDSVLAVGIVKSINDEFHLSLRVTDLFSYSSIRELAAHILSLGPIASAEPPPAPAPQDPPREVRPDDFAVIGIAGRFPGADHLDDFWPALARGVDAVAPAPADRWPEKPADGAAPRPRGGFLRSIAEFDPLFFNLSPLEAEVMDPQQRLFLQEAWRALEDAGYSNARLDNLRCGVFVGVGPSDYGDRLLSHPESVSPQAFTGNATSILAARIAYFLNLKGPTIAIDTACSSSLVAVHLACQSILSGDSDLAIAGGVHVMATPRIHALSLRAGMLSPRGACRTFDQGADGMVLGEGVGAVVLKRLSHALRDGDPIHAVIRGSGVNQDGRTNGITAPSARSQTALELAVYEKCGVNPDTISYVEAHGTGTPLGDPIELRALTDAFRPATARTQFCALGSVKTNIGHLMTAAGIASLLKAILCLKHRQIPASLHFEVPNEHCDFAGSPFYVNRMLQPWGQTPTAVLRAAVSSFGFSGTNAHVVLESAPAASAGAAAESAPFHLIALSARTAEALQERTSDLLRWLETQDQALDLADLAFTLGARRTHFDLRSAWVVTDRDSLLVALRRGPAAPLISTDDPALSPDTLRERASALVASLQPGALAAEACRAQLVALARCYEAGASVPWDRLFAGRPARCLRLPSYPFSRDTHWIPLPGTAAPTRPQAAPVPVTRGRRVFRPDEWLVQEHRVAGRALVPGTGWLELALEAAGRSQPPAGQPRLCDVTWPAPLALGAEDAEVHWELAPDERGGLACRIRSGATADGPTHLQCRIEFNPAPATADEPAVDLATVLQRPPDRNRAAEIYPCFARLGLDYGPRFQGLQAIWSGPGEAWGRIVAPHPAELAGCLLHPALLDAALQTTAFVGLTATDPLRGGALPFAIGEVERVRPLTAEMYARARLLEESSTAGFRTFHIDLFNTEGQRLVSLRQFSVRAAPTSPGDSPPEEDFCYCPVWRAEPLGAGAANPAAAAAGDPVLILRAAHDGGLGAVLARLHPGRRIVTVYLGRRFERLSDRTLAVDATSAADWARLAGECGGGATLYFLSALAPVASPVDLAGLQAAQEIGALSLFRLVQAFQCHDRPPGRLSVKVVTANLHQVGESGADLEPWYAALPGLAKVVSRECPTVAVSTIDLERAELAGDGVAQLAAAIVAESAPAHAHDVALRGGQRFTRHFTAVAPEPAPSPAPRPPFRTGGTYLILGGAGGIGLELARRLVEQYQARLILVGRRPLDSALAHRLRELESRGGAALYCQADGTDPVAMRRVVEQAHERFGPIHGAIQSALVLHDAALWKMDEAGFRAACEPKVIGSWILAAAVADEPLDFLAFFSSAAGVFGNAGQGNYAAGCAFKDAFAHYLSRHRTHPVRVFDWGYWGEAGAVATETYRKQLAKNGMLPLSTAEGLAAFERVMAGPQVQVMPLKLTAAARTALGLAAPAAAAGFAGLTAPLHERARAGAPGAELHAGLQALEDHGRRRLVAILDRMSPEGRLPQGDAEALASLLGIAPRCTRLFRALLRCTERADRDSAASVAHPSLRASSDARLQPYWRLLEACLDQLPEILRGSVRATAVLFPGNSLALVEPIYAGNPIADFFNQLLAAACGLTVAAIRRPATGTPIRILEIGAGTGGASVGVLRALQSSGERIEYVYTDVSPVFVEAARVKFAAHGFVSYRTLDIEQEPESQGYAPGSFDLVIASNVLHASEQLRPVLERVHALLKPGGFLLLNELTRASDFLLLTFGLTEGWWKYTDADLRSEDSPLLTGPQWQHALQQAGFSATAGFGGEPWGDNVILAQRNTAPARPTPTASLPSIPPVALTSPAVSPGGPPGTDAEFRSRVSSLLWGHFVQGLKLQGREAAPPPPRATFDRYGVDSLVTTDLIARLERQFGQLPKTLLFEQTSLGALTDYFLQHHRPTLARLLGERPAVVAAAAAPAPSVTARPAPAAPTAVVQAAPAGAPAPAGVEEIAIVGVSGRYPLANDIHEFWANLQAGRDCITPIPPARWDVARFNGEQATDENRRSYGTRGGFISGVDQFDPLFFNISPREAELMDPQERLFLQAAWSAMEDAGYTRHRLSYPHADSGTRQKVGVFAGVMYGSYQLYGAEEWARGRFVNTGSGYWSVANRVSYTLDLEGPSFAVDSACSSSLTALHLACESLRRGECDTALAGGVNLILHPSRYAQLCAVRMLSPDGVCRPFGAGANGFVEGEGVGVLLLKPRAAAERDGDTIYALIKGSAINSGGRTHGYTVPNPGAQANLIRAALDRAGLRADALNYLEAHGTGTSLGDPIEVAGLSQAFRTDHAARNACVLGSVKANIGHLEAAAGIASVTKVLLMLKHRRLVPSLHADSPNPLIDFAASPFRLQPTLADWPAPPAATAAGAPAPRRAGISSFGAGGANAHMILEEYLPPARRAPAEPRPQLVVLSAQNPARLNAAARQLLDLARRPSPDLPFDDAVFTLQTGREAFDQRLAFVADDWARLAAQLEKFLGSPTPGEDFYLGNARTPGLHPAALLQDSAPERAFIRDLFAAGRWGKLAAFWVSGSEIDWAELHSNSAARRVPLPTYPFAQVRCWFEASAPDARPGASPSAALHPLLDTNLSTLHEVRFGKVFRAAEDVLRDHEVAGQSVLPGVAYLEMVRAAAARARELPVTAVSNIVWMRPLVVADTPVPTFVSLQPHGERLDWEIWTQPAGERIVHARGRIAEEAPAREATMPFDLAQFTAHRTAAFDRTTLYRDFAHRGLHYGPGLQTITQLWLGPGEALARLELPPGSARTDDTIWPPGLLDGALQTIVGLSAGAEEGGLLLPFALRRLRGFGRLPDQCYALARPSAVAQGQADVRKFDVHLLDDAGNLLLSLEECAFRAIRTDRPAPPGAPTPPPIAAASPDPVSALPPAALNRLLHQLASRQIGWEEASRATRIEHLAPPTASRPRP